MKGTFVRRRKLVTMKCTRRQKILMILVHLLLFAVYVWYNDDTSTMITVINTGKENTKRQDDVFGITTEITLEQCIHGDTAIVISSSWIKSFPTLYFIREVVDSLSMLNGLSNIAPIIITVDGIKTTNLEGKKELLEYQEKQQQLDSYVEMLYHEYHNRTNIHIFTNIAHQHISGSVQKAMALVKSQYGNCIEFVYYLQHDFSFLERIHHSSLVKTAKENDSINIVRFRYRDSLREGRMLCAGNETPVLIETDNISLSATRMYSDNNHFAKFNYYKNMVDNLGKVPRAPEGPMQYKSGYAQNCTDLKMWCYMNPSTGRHITTLNHLDGRLSNIIETEKEANATQEV